MLLSPDMCSLSCDYIQDLLRTFVINFSAIHGKEQLTYNVHSLLPLVDDARQYGCLDNVSCFHFENALGKIKRMIRKPQSPVAQICRRITELHFGMDATNVSKHHVQHYSGPNMKGCETLQQFKKFSCEKFVLSVFCGNNCLSVDGVVRNILYSHSGAIFVVFSPFEKIEPFSSYPFSLSFEFIYSFLAQY